VLRRVETAQATIIPATEPLSSVFPGFRFLDANNREGWKQLRLRLLSPLSVQHILERPTAGRRPIGTTQID